MAFLSTQLNAGLPPEAAGTSGWTQQQALSWALSSLGSLAAPVSEIPRTVSEPHSVRGAAPLAHQLCRILDSSTHPAGLCSNKMWATSGAPQIRKCVLSVQAVGHQQQHQFVRKAAAGSRASHRGSEVSEDKIQELSWSQTSHVISSSPVQISCLESASKKA